MKRDPNTRLAVVAVEAVEVLAGRFETLKVVRETDGRDFDEYWYAPGGTLARALEGRRGGPRVRGASTVLRAGAAPHSAGQRRRAALTVTSAATSAVRARDRASS